MKGIIFICYETTEGVQEYWMKNRWDLSRTENDLLAIVENSDNDRECFRVYEILLRKGDAKTLHKDACTLLERNVFAFSFSEPWVNVTFGDFETLQPVSVKTFTFSEKNYLENYNKRFSLRIDKVFTTIGCHHHHHSPCSHVIE